MPRHCPSKFQNCSGAVNHLIDTFNHDCWHLFLFSTSPFHPSLKNSVWVSSLISSKMTLCELMVPSRQKCAGMDLRMLWASSLIAISWWGGAASFPLLHSSISPSLPGELANALTFLAQQLALSSIARWDPCPIHSVQSWSHSSSVSYTIWAGSWMESMQCTLRITFCHRWKQRKANNCPSIGT